MADFHGVPTKWRVRQVLSPYRETLIRNGFRNRLRFLPDEVAFRYAEIYRSLAG